MSQYTSSRYYRSEHAASITQLFKSLIQENETSILDGFQCELFAANEQNEQKLMKQIQASITLIISN